MIKRRFGTKNFLKKFRQSITKPKKKKILSSIDSIQSEKDLQIQCNDWLNKNYPEFRKIFFFNSFQGMRLLGWQIAEAEKTGGLKSGLPDFIFLKNNGTYSGLFIELKIKSPFKRDGKLKADKTGHLQLQQDVINQLLIEGHYACFCWNFIDFQNLIKNFLENRL